MTARVYCLSILTTSVFSVVFATPLFGLDQSIRDGANAARGSGVPADLFGNAGIFTDIVNTLLFIIGALSVIMIIIGGFRYVVSGGSSTAVTSAKNTILYAIVGLVIAFLAYAIISYVLGTLATGGGSGTNL
ncbi:MAG: hypothetical protein ABI716_03425 [Candidatus Saccharibacteria bacterium]